MQGSHSYLYKYVSIQVAFFFLLRIQQKKNKKTYFFSLDIVNERPHVCIVIHEVHSGVGCFTVAPYSLAKSATHFTG